jgi:hypothetical protein
LKPAGRGAILPVMTLPHVIFPEGLDCPFSGLRPLAEVLPMAPVYCREAYSAVMKRSWALGHVLQQWGVRHYGSTWNSLVPWWDEARILRRLPRSADLYPVHFIFGEFVAPRQAAPYRRRGARVVVSVHCSARRWDSVWLRPDGYACADQVVLTSESQRAAVERNVAPERVCTILHGVAANTSRRCRTARRGALAGSGCSCWEIPSGTMSLPRRWPQSCQRIGSSGGSGRPHTRRRSMRGFPV